MNLKNRMKEKNSKEGSYVVEASLTLPILIIAACALLSIITIISICESICFNVTLELKEASLRAYSQNEAVSLCRKIEQEVLESCEKLNDFQITKNRYMYWDSRMGVYDLISVDADAVFTVHNTVGLGGKIEFEGKVLTRAFTGSLQDSYGLGETGFTGGRSQLVWIFPKYGEKFHGEKCIYVRNADNNAEVISIQKQDAERKGLEPCLICGGI